MDFEYLSDHLTDHIQLCVDTSSTVFEDNKLQFGDDILSCFHR